ncbi:MAG: putative glycosyltransferase [Ignavibacteria bacterium]|nr:MAG: putative glycosyltransferase [Ignavibacteria bacterium]KAF0161226.1 MAG: putative glycosyltransferase [Ignavibacteria bacterium]
MISIIIIQYNSQELTTQAIDSIKKHLTGNYEIIVVDNASPNSDLEQLLSAHQDINLIRNKENYGFGKANNIAAEQAKGDIFLFLNNDTIVKSNFIPFVESCFENEQDLGGLAPKLLNADGTLQISVGPLPSIVTEFWVKFSSNLFYRKREPFLSYFNKYYSTCHDVDFATGAAFFMKKNTFEIIEGFDENIFMYFDDSILCKKIKELGFRIHYTPEFEITHYGGASWNEQITTFLEKHYRKSQLYYYKKYRPAIENFLLRIYLKLANKEMD